MDLHIDMERQDGMLLVTATGSLKFDAVLRCFIQVFEHAAANRLDRVLVNGLAVDGELAAHERYRLGVDLARHLAEHRQSVRMALVGVPPAVNGFGMLVARNRGMDAEVFSTPREAMSWLDESPGEPPRDEAGTVVQDS